MRLLSSIARLLGISLLMSCGCQSTQPRIDGSSETSFLESHDRLVSALTPENRLRLSLAEVIYLAPFPCAAEKDPIAESPMLTQVLGGQISLKACRRELDGMTFRDIMSLAYRKK